MQIQYGPLYVRFVLFYKKKNESQGPPLLTVHPLAPIFNPGWCLGKDGDGESSGLKQLAAAEARPLLYERFGVFLCRNLAAPAEAPGSAHAGGGAMG